MTQHARWLELAKNKNITAADCATLCLYRTILKSDDVGQQTENAVMHLKRAFSPISNTVKLENGASKYAALKQSLALLKYSNFFLALEFPAQEKISTLAKEVYRRF